MIISSGSGEGFVPSPQSVSHQPSARKRTIHSLITCQSLHTKLALLYFLFFFLALSVATGINSH